MKSKFKNIIGVFLLISSSLIFIACDPAPKSKTPSKSVRQVRNSNFNGNQMNYLSPQNSNTINQYDSGLGAWSNIYSNYSSEFNSAVKAMLSSAFNPNEIGTIDSKQGVYFQAAIEMDSQGRINASNSELRMEIWDSYALSKQADPIVLTFSSAKTAQINGSQITLVFEDEYGNIIFNGVKSGNMFTGQVDFNNTVYFDHSRNPLSGTMGDFNISFCSMFTCN